LAAARPTSKVDVEWSRRRVYMDCGITAATGVVGLTVSDR